MTEIIAADDYNEIDGIVAASAPRAVTLSAITAYMDELLHTVWLDEDSATVWHAWEDLDSPGEWRLQAYPADVAAQTWLREAISPALDNLADPSGSDEYRHHPDAVERDLTLLEELQEVELAALRARAAELGPPAVDGMIVGRMQRRRAEISRVAALRAMHLRQTYGPGRGAAAAAARDLGCSHETARRAIAAGEEYVARARDGARRAGAT